ncbi:hypothetical protein CDL12_30474 [Handroanthus impetiginosus]|uniref:S-protein homolog n=1 Tax=Handroanthus impetiginosus TaxID=429701 RepID=A0A2G9FVF2_9LAMI|nr:hypothetical protein CDL12_30474 [Handroanthus impetiginosus]
MNSLAKKRLIFLFFISMSYNDFTVAISSLYKTSVKLENIKTLPREKFDVYIHNSLPNNNSPLLIHCFSGDDDFGNHTLRMNEDFHWEFRMNIILSTEYFCRFRWGSRDKRYKVFNKHLAPNCEGFKAKDPNICYWSIRDDGFWISNQIPPITLVQIYTW